MEKDFALYRYHYANGTGKDWAISVDTNSNTIEVRFGKAGQLSQLRVIESAKPLREAERRTKEKINKGYRFVGHVCIEPQGHPYETPHAINKKLATNNITWSFRTRNNVEPQIVLVKKTVFDLANKLEQQSLAVIDEHSVKLAHWSIGFCATALPGSNRISTVSGEGAGFINSDDGPLPLLLLLALKRRLPSHCTLVIAAPDGIEISDQLRLEKDVLSFLGSELDEVRPVAEALGLIAPKIDLNQSSPESKNYYF